MDQILIFGASGHAKAIVNALLSNNIQPRGYIDSIKEINSFVMGFPVLGTEAQLHDMLVDGKSNSIILAIGDNYSRMLIAQRLQKQYPQLKFPSVFHRNTIVSESTIIGKGAVILPGAVIGPEATLGNFCIINTNASLDHDGKMDDFSSLAPNSVTGGNVAIGKFSAIGLGAMILHKISIGSNSVVGAGAVVTKNIPDDSVAYGNPAKIIRQRKQGEKYL